MVVLISVDDPTLHPDASALGDAVVYARKQDLRPQQVKQIWGSPPPSKSTTGEKAPRRSPCA